MIDPKDFPTRAAFERARFDAIHAGRVPLKFFPPPVRIKILMVADGYPGNFLNVTYGQLYFSLSAVVDTLTNNPEPWVKFDLTKAHRQTDPLGAADIDGFRFTRPGFDINAYDQVWFFGARSGENETLRLADDELAILARWMDERHGGVFAVGDHAEIGSSLCARIPRVRAMRRWTTAQGVPQPNGPNRHDTLRPGYDGIYQFNDESDDIPMAITPKMFPLPSLTWQTRESPHPVLCGTAGIIKVFPDHPHEGEVIEPASLTNNFSFPGYANKPEFPLKLDGSGQRELAHVIATAQVHARTTPQDTNKGACNAKTIGVAGAYNGHASGVGRVVVDSTWHHWFDVNLIGRPLGSVADPIDDVPATDPKHFGFPHSPAGQAAYAQIRNYFRNVALWLSSPTRQDQLFFRATWRIVFIYPLVEQLHHKLPIWELGGYAVDAIGRMAGQCTVRSWLWDRLPIAWRKPFFEPDPEPCLTCPPIDALERYLIGGIVRELILADEKGRDQPEGIGEAQAAAAMVRGLDMAAKEFTQMFERSLARSAAVSKSLSSNEPFKLTPKSFIAPADRVAGPVKPARKAGSKAKGKKAS